MKTLADALMWVNLILVTAMAGVVLACAFEVATMSKRLIRIEQHVERASSELWLIRKYREP